MVPDTLQALAIVLLAVLPGALYTWALEREAGNWGIGVSDRVLRFVGVSALFQAAFVYPLYRVWTSFLHRAEVSPQGATRFRNLLLEGAPLPWWLWLVPLACVALPVGIGTLAGLSVNPRSVWHPASRVLVGRDPAPRSWDYLFSPRPAGMVRAQLKDGSWIGGLFADRSYAAGYPEEPQDVYLEELWSMTLDGEFISPLTDENFDSHGALIRWDETKLLEFFHLPVQEDGNG